MIQKTLILVLILFILAPVCADQPIPSGIMKSPPVNYPSNVPSAYNSPFDGASQRGDNSGQFSSSPGEQIGPGSQGSQKPAERMAGDDHNRLIVKYKNTVPGSPDSLSKIEMNMNEKVGTSVIRDMKDMGIPGMQIVAVSGISMNEAIASYRQNSSVEYAEPDYIISLYSSQAEPVISEVPGSLTPGSNNSPNDPDYPYQWGLHNAGQSPFNGTGGADTGAEKAWKVTTGSADITVAVIDTGVDYTHEDLHGNIWNNTREIPGNGIDDDGNGYIDDTYGWNFLGKNNTPMDDNGHGTHCAGIIGAAGNNNLGIAGINWKVKIMPLKFMNSTGNGYISDAISSILYANKMGADVISCSWSGPQYSQAFKDAIDASSAVVVCAAGNDNTDDDREPTYPACYNSSNLISVTATNQNDELAPFSNYGMNSVDIAAPGVKIASTYPGDQYRYMSGTSMATPFVSGTAALIKAKYPSESNIQIRERILSTVDRISSCTEKIASGGRLNVSKAVQDDSETRTAETSKITDSHQIFTLLGGY